MVFSLQILNEFAESQSSSKSLFLHKLFIFNNNACLRTCIGDLDKSKKQLKSLLQEQNISEIHFTIITNNLASIYLKKREFLKAYKSSESGLFKLEPIIFKQMKDANGQGKNFIKDLIVLLQGYLNYARCLIYLQSSPESITDNNLKSQIMAKNPKTFYRNGQKLSFKYLGQECYLAKKFSAYLSMNQKNNTVRIETFHDEMPLDFNMKSNNPSEIHKKNFQINEISESLTQEDSFDKTFDNPKKNFIIKNKTHHRNYKSQMEFGKTNEINRYNEKDYYETMDKMREMEENLRRIQNLREKYKYEKQLIETDYHYIKTKSLEYFNPQNRMQSPNFNNWVMPPPSNFINPQNISVPQNFENINNNNYWQHQFSLMDPMNQNNLPNSNMNNINMANYNSLSTSPNHFFQNPPSTDTNRNLDSEEKNNDFEKLLITLKNDKERIIKESQEKDKEIQRLKENLIKKEKERPIVKNLNQSSNSLFNDETQNNPETLNYHKKSNSTFTKSINKTANPTPSNTPIQPTTKELKQSSNLQKPKLNMDSSSVVKVDQDKTRAISFSGPLSLNEKTKEIQKKEAPLIDKPITSLKHLPDNNPLSKKTAFLKSESNKTLVKLISLMEKKGSIKNIKTENFRRTSIIDTIPKINTPFEVFKSLAVPKFSVVKKKVIVENELFLFEFRTLLNDNKDEVYWIEGYNLETAKAMKTAILKEDILKKVLDSINFEDIIPLTHPLNSISQYLDFVKYFIMPFIGVFILFFN